MCVSLTQTVRASQTGSSSSRLVASDVSATRSATVVVAVVAVAVLCIDSDSVDEFLSLLRVACFAVFPRFFRCRHRFFARVRSFCSFARAPPTTTQTHTHTHTEITHCTPSRRWQCVCVCLFVCKCMCVFNFFFIAAAFLFNVLCFFAVFSCCCCFFSVYFSLRVRVCVFLLLN